MKHWPFLVLAAAAVFIPATAAACIYPPPVPPKAGETGDQYSARVKSELDQFLREAARKLEKSYFDEALRVYLARVVRNEEIGVNGTPFARRSVLKPVRTVKGLLPGHSIVIRDRELTSCGLGGDGPATFANVGHTVVVFDGVRNEGMGFRSRRYAILAESAQEPRLLEALHSWKPSLGGTRERR